MLTPFKNRKLDRTKPVEMYRCLNRKGYIFSLRQGGKVVAHTDSIVLKDCEFIVNEAGKRRCIENQQRNVHAYIKGYVTDTSEVRLTFSFEVKENPYKNIGFYYELLGFTEEIKNTRIVYFDKPLKRLLFQI